jgi:hypothetical protein
MSPLNKCLQRPEDRRILAPVLTFRKRVTNGGRYGEIGPVPALREAVSLQGKQEILLRLLPFPGVAAEKQRPSRLVPPLWEGHEETTMKPRPPPSLFGFRSKLDPRYVKYKKRLAATERKKRSAIRRLGQGADASRTSHYMSVYGFDKDLAKALANPRNRTSPCPICKVTKVLVVDHNHATGKVRGLICNSCNHMLGVAKDSIDVLRSAIEYLIQRDELTVPPACPQCGRRGL